MGLSNTVETLKQQCKIQYRQTNRQSERSPYSRLIILILSLVIIFINPSILNENWETCCFSLFVHLSVWSIFTIGCNPSPATIYTGHSVCTWYALVSELNTFRLPPCDLDLEPVTLDDPLTASVIGQFVKFLLYF